MRPTLPRVVVIGGGPAGLRAAEVAVEGGASVTLFDAKPSVGRKFLVAGRGGLNLTHAESRESFVSRYSGLGQGEERWTSLLADFGPEALRLWAAGLGVETFAAGTGRVYPKELKAAPLLRRWVQRLREEGVHFAMNHRLAALRHGTEWTIDFDCGGETRTVATDAVILALGGGSWPQTGSDGGWVPMLEGLGVVITPLRSSNCGWNVAWSPALLAAAEGKPLKNIIAYAGELSAMGELLITADGLEGGVIYQLGPALSAMPMPEIVIDFKPSHTIEQLVRKLGTARSRFLAEARSRWRLSDAVFSILESKSVEQPFASAEALAATTKRCAIRLTSPRPLAEAISSAGGIHWDELDSNLMLRRLPGVFAAGEMIDWDAPTGGYLMQGCFASATRAARSALEWRTQKI